MASIWPWLCYVIKEDGTSIPALQKSSRTVIVSSSLVPLRYDKLVRNVREKPIPPEERVRRPASPTFRPRRATGIVRGDESGRDGDNPRRRVAAPPRPRRGYSAETRVAASPKPPRGYSVETTRGAAAAARRGSSAPPRSVHRCDTNTSHKVGASIRHSFTVSANMVVTPVATGFIGYRLSKGLVPKEQHRVVVGLLIGIGMLLVEMVLYLARSYSVEAHTARRKRRTGRWDGRTVTTKLD